MKRSGRLESIRAHVRAAATAVLLVACVAPLVAAQDSGIPVGSAGPDAALETLAGEPVQLHSVVGEKPVLIEFWATWCSVCKALEPTITAAQKKFGDRVHFVGVAVSANQSAERVRRYTAEHMRGFTHFYDRRGHGVEAYDVPATSYIVVLDASGKVVYTGVGEDQDLDAVLTKVLR